jgi:hypothetical protein
MVFRCWKELGPDVCSLETPKWPSIISTSNWSHTPNSGPKKGIFFHSCAYWPRWDFTSFYIPALYLCPLPNPTCLGFVSQQDQECFALPPHSDQHWVPLFLLSSVTWLEHEADCSPPPSAEVKNLWSFTSTPCIHLHPCVYAQGQLHTFFYSDPFFWDLMKFDLNWYNLGVPFDQ